MGSTQPLPGAAPQAPLLPGQKPQDWVMPGQTDPSAKPGVADDIGNSISKPNIDKDVFLYLEYTKDQDDITLDKLYLYNESDFKLYVGLIRFSQRDFMGFPKQNYDWSPDLPLVRPPTGSGTVYTMYPHTSSPFSLYGTSSNPNNEFNVSFGSHVTMTIVMADPNASISIIPMNITLPH